MSLLSLAVMAALTLPVYAEEETVNTHDVLVTASRTQQEVKETPSAVEVITREDFHSRYRLGVVEKLQMLNPELAIAVITPVYVEEFGVVPGLAAKYKDDGDIIICLHF